MSSLNVSHLQVHSADLQHLLLKDVNFSLSAGEVLAVVGPNGAGKSTLLHALIGDIAITAGNVELPVTELNQAQRARQIAVLPQFSLLNFPYRVTEVVQLGRIPHNTGRNIDQQIITQALAAMDISYLSDRLYTELSGGEKQRVQLARVLAQIWRAEDCQNQQRMLLLDEPTTALDLGHQHQLMQAIRTFVEQGVMVIMILHDLNLAARYADKILALLCSRQLAFGSCDEVITADIVAKLFSSDVSVLHHPQYSTPIVLGK